MINNLNFRPLTANPTVLGTKFHPISSTRDSLHIKDQRSDTEKLLDRLASGLKQEIVKRRIRMIQTAQQELMASVLLQTLTS